MPGVRGNLYRVIKNRDNLYQGDLVSYFGIISHAKNVNNPYHNFGHMCNVLWLCHQACVFYSGSLSRRKIRSLLIAALFHDYNHIGMSVPDSDNIAIAVVGLKRNILPEDVSELDGIVNLIERATEFPHKIHSSSLSLSGQILRDADLGQSFGVVWIQQVIFGLAAEKGIKPLEMLKEHLLFLNKLKFQTFWARDMFSRSHIQEKIDEAEELLDIWGDR